MLVLFCVMCACMHVYAMYEFVKVLNQESGSASHPESAALGSRSGWNDSRDFWRFTDIPVETWLWTFVWGYVMLEMGGALLFGLVIHYYIIFQLR